MRVLAFIGLFSLPICFALGLCIAWWNIMTHFGDSTLPTLFRYGVETLFIIGYLIAYLLVALPWWTEPSDAPGWSKISTIIMQVGGLALLVVALAFF